MTRTRLIAVVAAIVALVVAAPIAARNSASSATKLTGVDGPGFTITLKKGTAKVSKLKAGKYTFAIQDKSSAHNFHLKGPGVNKMTSVAKVGNTTWTVTLKKGKYTYVCDPHAAIMKGSFTVT